MLPTLREVLALPALRAAAVDVIVGEPENVHVRWVHSSEVYEMGGLLAGGELLLTTGLGLHGRSAEQLAAYVDQLADAGCVALALELGRSYFSVPTAMVQAAEQRGVVLLTLGAVVPFERIIEDFHELMVRRRTASHDSILFELVAIVQHGQGLRSLLDAIARIAGCPVEVRDLDDHVIERSAITVPGAVGEPTTIPVRGAQGALGRLLMYRSTEGLPAQAVEHAALAVGLELARTAEPHPTTLSVLIADLLAGTSMSHREVAERLMAAGWRGRSDSCISVALLRPESPTLAVAAIRAQLPSTLGTGLVAVAGADVVLLTPRPPGESPQRLRRLIAELQSAAAAQSHTVFQVALADPVADWSDLSHALREARAIARLARRAGRSDEVVMARDVGVEQLLESAGTQATRLLIERQLGALIASDTRSTSDLVRTLDAYLQFGGSKSAAANALGIRRQTLYSRLWRIEGLLGVDLGDGCDSDRSRRRDPRLADALRRRPANRLRPAVSDRIPSSTYDRRLGPHSRCSSRQSPRALPVVE